MNKSTNQGVLSRGTRPPLAPAELRNRRLALGMTQTALADAVDVSANTIARWERGELGIRDPGRIARRLERLERPQLSKKWDRHVFSASPPPRNRRSGSDRAVQSRLTGERLRSLPIELSSFVGRLQEIPELIRVLGLHGS